MDSRNFTTMFCLVHQKGSMHSMKYIFMMSFSVFSIEEVQVIRVTFLVLIFFFQFLVEELSVKVKFLISQ